MKQFENIVVVSSLDGRDAGAFAHAAAVARVSHSKRIIVAHVVESPEFAPNRETVVDSQVLDRLRQSTEWWRTELPAEVEIEFVVRGGSRVTEVVQLASRCSADLVCVARWTDTTRPANELVRLVRKTPCSTLVVPAGEVRYGQLLVPVDFSDRSREALDLAVAIGATQPGAAITAIHVCSAPTGYHKTGRTHEDFEQSVEEHAREEWSELISEVELHGVPCDIRYDHGDDVPGTIVQVAERVGADLILMASHGRTLPAATLLGHVAETVCSQTHRPFLCVKRKGEVVTLLRALLQLLDIEAA